MDICESHKALASEVRNFILNVGDIKEESITDFLVWKWRELDKRFNYLSVRTFNHDEESARTGADFDFDLELWLVGRRTHVALAVQAKKFVRQHDSYVRKLRYPNGTKQQMDTLIRYAASNNRLPYYFFYALSGPAMTSRCAASSLDGAVFVAEAGVMEEFADGKRGGRVSRDALLAECSPFHCLFCCPFGATKSNLRIYYPLGGDSATGLPNSDLPAYVKALLRDSRGNVDEQGAQRDSNEGWSRFRAVGVYDLRNDA
ncbi:MAG: DUF6615 family protein [Lysobacterales bacterium]